MTEEAWRRTSWPATQERDRRPGTGMARLAVQPSLRRTHELVYNFHTCESLDQPSYLRLSTCSAFLTHTVHTFSLSVTPRASQVISRQVSTGEGSSLLLNSCHHAATREVYRHPSVPHPSLARCIIVLWTCGISAVCCWRGWRSAKCWGKLEWRK